MGDNDTMNAFENSLSDSAFHSIMTEQLYEACKGVGIKVYSDDECCRAMAWLLIYGGGNENVLSGSIFQVIKCAQSRLNLFGGEFDHLRGTLYKEKDYIMELINEGFTNTQIIAKLQKEKGHNYCESKIRRFINETPEIRNLLIQRQNEIRPIANAECGKNKGRYRY